MPYTRSELAAAIQICPFLVRVEIFNDPGFVNDELKVLLGLKQLQCLILEHVSVSFDGGLLPILQKFGPNSLEKLGLDSVNDVDVAAIVKHCPNLRSLLLSGIDRYIQSSHSLQPPQYQLLKLEKLSLKHDGSMTINAPTLADLSILLLFAFTGQAHAERFQRTADRSADPTGCRASRFSQVEAIGAPKLRRNYEAFDRSPVEFEFANYEPRAGRVLSNGPTRCGRVE